MCGIVGYIGNDDVTTTLVDTLRLLEYRGYDSAGVAVLSKGKIKITKEVGRIDNLYNAIKPDSSATSGIAHTRWATNGAPSKNNAHPHISNSRDWAIVHNGIIENSASLKCDLIAKGFTFYGETDTEVIANMLDYKKSEVNINTLIDVCKLLKGSFALACINRKQKDTLFLARKKSPLYIATKNGEVLIASDPICFFGKMDEYYSLGENEFCTATKDSIIFYNINGVKIIKNSIKIDKFDVNASKKEFPYYMIKEIYEIPEVFGRIARVYEDNKILNKFDKKFIEKFNKIVLIGCGTAYHASLLGAKYIEKFARIPARAYIASEYRYSVPIIDSKTLFILVSQSGETADTLAALELAEKYGATTIALTNVLYSSLAKKCQFVMPVCAGPEIAVASTKAYSAQSAILYMLAKQLQNAKFGKKYNPIKQIKKLSSKFSFNKFKDIVKLSDEIKNMDSTFFIGRGLDYVTCEESSLKLKEITYINSSAYPAGELKHGFLALISKDTYLFVIATQKDVLDKTLSGAYEAEARGAKIIIITQLNIPKEKLENIYKVVKLQKFDDEIMPIISVTFGQLLAYHTSIKKGLNPDQPRNLAKSVTVE